MLSGAAVTPFDGEACPLRRGYWWRAAGKRLVVDAFSTARQLGITPTGHAARGGAAALPTSLPRMSHLGWNRQLDRIDSHF
jgi:hypothetical protein